LVIDLQEKFGAKSSVAIRAKFCTQTIFATRFFAFSNVVDRDKI